MLVVVDVVGRSRFISCSMVLFSFADVNKKTTSTTEKQKEKTCKSIGCGAPSMWKRWKDDSHKNYYQIHTISTWFHWHLREFKLWTPKEDMDYLIQDRWYRKYFSCGAINHWSYIFFKGGVLLVRQKKNIWVENTRNEITKFKNINFFLAVWLFHCIGFIFFSY